MPYHMIRANNIPLSNFNFNLYKSTQTHSTHTQPAHTKCYGVVYGLSGSSWHCFFWFMALSFPHRHRTCSFIFLHSMILNTIILSFSIPLLFPHFIWAIKFIYNNKYNCVEWLSVCAAYTHLMCLCLQHNLICWFWSFPLIFQCEWVSVHSVLGVLSRHINDRAGEIYTTVFLFIYAGAIIIYRCMAYSLMPAICPSILFPTFGLGAFFYYSLNSSLIF